MERSQDEITRVCDWAQESVDGGTSRYCGMSYEQGVLDALNWVTGLEDHAPDED